MVLQWSTAKIFYLWDCSLCFQKSAEALVREPINQQQINIVENGGHVTAKSGKFFLVRLLGDVPELDAKSPFLQASLGAGILRVVCGYLHAFGRLAGIELWY